MAIGILLATIQYIYNRSIWNDEAMLANNILRRDYIGLLEPLDNLQVAPILFLWIERIFLQVLPYPEYALRFFPFILYLFSIVLFFRLVDKMITDRPIQYFVWILFIGNMPLLYYASEVKQYMGDVFSTLLIYSLLFREFSKQRNKVVSLAIAGAGIVWLSNVAPIILLASLVFLIFANKESLSPKYLSYVIVSWGISFGLYYVFFINNHPLKSGMQEFWMEQYGFLPEFSDQQRLGMFFKIKFVMFFRTMLGLGTYGKYLMALLFIVGLIGVLRKKKTGAFVLLFLPLLTHFLLSVLQMYPLETRLMLYYVPLLILILGLGLEYSIRTIGLRSKFLVYSVVLLTVLFSFSGNMIRDFPQQNSEIRALLDYINERYQKEDKLIIATISIPSYEFYQQIGYMDYDSEKEYFSYEGLAKLNENEKLEGDYWVVVSQFEVQGIAVGMEIKELQGKILDTYCVTDACLYKIRIDSERNYQ